MFFLYQININYLCDEHNRSNPIIYNLHVLPIVFFLYRIGIDYSCNKQLNIFSQRWIKCVCSICKSHCKPTKVYLTRGYYV